LIKEYQGTLLKDYLPTLGKSIIEHIDKNKHSNCEDTNLQIDHIMNTYLENQKIQHDLVIEKFENLHQINNYYSKFMSDIETALKSIRKNISDSFESISTSRLETTNSINDIHSDLNVLSN